jgi:hypothetical protein
LYERKDGWNRGGEGIEKEGGKEGGRRRGSLACAPRNAFTYLKASKMGRFKKEGDIYHVLPNSAR